LTYLYQKFNFIAISKWFFPDEKRGNDKGGGWMWLKDPLLNSAQARRVEFMRQSMFSHFGE
jgi:hypothetical protein